MERKKAWGYIGMDCDNACLENVKREYLLDFMRKNQYEVMGVSAGRDGATVREVLKCRMMKRLLDAANDNRMDIVLMADYSFQSRSAGLSVDAETINARMDECVNLLERYKVEMTVEEWLPKRGFAFMRIQYPVKAQ